MTNIFDFLREKLSTEQKENMRKLLRGCLRLFPYSENLELLALKYGTDKKKAFGGHGYVDYYQKVFGPIRRRRLNILEIGIGGYKNSKSGGGSLKMWQEYFPNSMIYGIDIEDKTCFDDRRIKIFQGDQSDPAFLAKVVEKIGQVDIVIDDGSHVNAHVITSFDTLFPFLSEGGIYVIEDLQTSYWADFGGSAQDFNTPNTSMGRLKRLTDGLNYRYIPGRKPSYLDEHIAAIHFYPEIVFVFKKSNTG